MWYEGSQVSAASRRYLHANHQGSIVAVTGASGNTLQVNAYDPYGVTGAGNTGRFQYTGQAAIPELGLLYYKARFYNAGLGRFMQTDPIGYEDDFNLYAYTRNDPLNNTDPTGECPWCLVGAVAGALVSAGVQYATTGKVDIQQVGIAAAAGFLTGGASTLIAANIALTSARIGLNAAAGAAIGGSQAAGSHVATTGVAPSAGQVATGAVVGAVAAGAGSAVGAVVESQAVSKAAGWIQAPPGANAATQSLVTQIKQTTLSAATEAEKQAAKAAPTLGNAASQVVQSNVEGAASMTQQQRAMCNKDQGTTGC